MTRILVLEDEKPVGDLLSEVLAAEGYTVTVAANRAEAEARAAAMRFELMVIDQMIPDGNGLDFAQRMRGESDAGIIMLTGKTDEVDRVVALELAADDYITKPFRPRELVARVRAVLRRIRAGQAAEPPPAERLLFHGFTLDATHRQLFDPQGAALSLTTQEFEVLQVLVRHRGSTLSREEISDLAGWNRQATQMRAVDGLVSRLRRKLDPSGKTHLIHTMHGRGYMLPA
jgi:two-component system phosphate regulon response regulator OmpR